MSPFLVLLKKAKGHIYISRNPKIMVQWQFLFNVVLLAHCENHNFTNCSTSALRVNLSVLSS